MTGKVYKSAQGKAVDLGAIVLRNEQVRAVGNMNVNARGDLLDSNNTIIETKPRTMQRQASLQNTVSDSHTVTTSNVHARKIRDQNVPDPVEEPEDSVVESAETSNDPISSVDDTEDDSVPRGGLAAAIARSRTIKQELEKTPRQQAQEQPIKKI
jgi:hypothetical protein